MGSLQSGKRHLGFSYSQAKGTLVKQVKMSAQTKVEVTRGVFDPRTYKQVDKENWARKRKPEWMATTGQIHFVRERTVASQERELEEERRAEAAQDEACQQELKAVLQEDQAPASAKVELVAPIKKQLVQWVGRKRSDITREGGFMGYFGRTV